MREMLKDYSKNNDVHIKAAIDINAVMRDMMSVLLEGILDKTLDKKLCYTKYDYRNGYSSKTMHTSGGVATIRIG